MENAMGGLVALAEQTASQEGSMLMPREKLFQLGPHALSDEELVAIFLATGTEQLSVLELAGKLLSKFNGLRGLMQAGQTELVAAHGVGTAKHAQLMSALEMSDRYLKLGMERGEVLSDPGSTRRFLMAKLRPYEREVFACLFLDNQHRLIAYEEMFFGTIDGASVHPREVLRRSLELNAAAVLFAHNHPSGLAEPSLADKRITQRLTAALKLVDIRVLDHMVVGDTEVISFAERGLIQ